MKTWLSLSLSLSMYTLYSNSSFIHIRSCVQTPHYRCLLQPVSTGSQVSLCILTKCIHSTVCYACTVSAQTRVKKERKKELIQRLPHATCCLWWGCEWLASKRSTLARCTRMRCGDTSTTQELTSLTLYTEVCTCVFVCMFTRPESVVKKKEGKVYHWWIYPFTASVSRVYKWTFIHSFIL